MKHVHAETIIELAQDMTKVVQVRIAHQNGDWCDFDTDQDKMKWLAQVSSSFETRIKPQPKAISWSSIYADGFVGLSFNERLEAEKEASFRSPHSRPIALVEVRDDGTAHLHKVEA